MATNQAAWLDGQGKQLRVATIEVPTPGPDEIVVRNHAVAINPVDCTSSELLNADKPSIAVCSRSRC